MVHLIALGGGREDSFWMKVSEFKEELSQWVSCIEITYKFILQGRHITIIGIGRCEDEESLLSALLK